MRIYGNSFHGVNTLGRSSCNETLTTEQLHDDMQITVCSECKQASCWLGEFYCDEYKTAGILSISVKQLRVMAMESPDYWAQEVRSRYGNS